MQPRQLKWHTHTDRICPARDLSLWYGNWLFLNPSSPSFFSSYLDKRRTGKKNELLDNIRERESSLGRLLAPRDAFISSAKRQWKETRERERDKTGPSARVSLPIIISRELCCIHDSTRTENEDASAPNPPSRRRKTRGQSSHWLGGH